MKNILHTTKERFRVSVNEFKKRKKFSIGFEEFFYLKNILLLKFFVKRKKLKFDEGTNKNVFNPN